MSIFFKHNAGGLSVFQYYVINVAIRNDVIRGPKLWHQLHIGTLLQRKKPVFKKKSSSLILHTDWDIYLAENWPLLYDICWYQYRQYSFINEKKYFPKHQEFVLSSFIVFINNKLSGKISYTTEKSIQNQNITLQKALQKKTPAYMFYGCHVGVEHTRPHPVEQHFSPPGHVLSPIQFSTHVPGTTTAGQVPGLISV